MASPQRGHRPKGGAHGTPRSRLDLRRVPMSRAKTLVLPGFEQALTELAPVSGFNLRESSKRSARRGSSSRTSRAGSGLGCPRCGETCTCLVTIRPPSRFLPSTSGRLTFDAESSSLLPTPSATSYGSNRGGAAGRTGPVRHPLPTLAKKGLLTLMATPTATANQLCPSMAKWPGCRAWQAAHPTGPLLPSFVEWMMGFPTDYTRLATPLCRSARRSSGA